GLAVARLLDLPLVGSYHTELGPYALHLTKDLVVADALEAYVHWFYRQCAAVLAPTKAVADELGGRGYTNRIVVWGRGVDSRRFSPSRLDPELRAELLGGGDTLLLSVGRVSEEKRIRVLLDAFEQLHPTLPGLRLAIVGDGPARALLEHSAGENVAFL